MDFDSLLCSNSATTNGADADLITRRSANEDDVSAFKMAKTSQMLCFSSQNPPSLAFPFFNGTSDAVTRGAVDVFSGYGFGGMNWGVKGPFSPSQWMELEHQALIYKYITANVSIPSYLLNPIRKALEASGFSCFSLLRPNALGWGGFHLGFSNTDPEPGRCRRTDGKKWRCSRDAVPDQKYCERHINRGRHRSRKPVEGHPGHSVTGTTTPVVPDGGNPPHHQKTNAAKTGIMDRSVVDKEKASGAYSTFPQPSGFKELSRSEFGLVNSDSLLNPLNRNSSLLNTRNYNNTESKSENVIRQFMEVYPRSHSPRLPLSWPDVDLQSDRTQLSISIPTASPTSEKLTVSPPENEATRMGLSVGAITNQRQNNWVPISSIGGPLGEALHTTSECKSSSKALNLMENWDHSPQGESSKAVYNGLVGQGLMLPSLPAL